MKRHLLALALSASLLLTGCATTGAPEQKTGAELLDPSNPVSITIWHYYNGTQQAAFDELTDEFNATEGNRLGIYVSGRSMGSVNDLADAVSSSAAQELSAEPLPDIFSSYADTAYSVQSRGLLADLTKYFTAEELSAYVENYIEEGYLNDDGHLYLFPTAKSTEITMVNTTDWAPFAEATGSTLDELTTIEGITRVADRYYEWTDAQTPDIPDDGKALYGRDSMSNYFVIGMRQMGVELMEVKASRMTLNPDKALLRRLWDNYYVPFVTGRFAALGKFRSDDVKTGDLLAYTGSSASAMYFPDRLELEDGTTRDIDYAILPAPVMEGGEAYRVQQGAGMCVTASDEQHEYAACVFLRWFTAKEQNLRFVYTSSYLPVLKEANTVEALDAVIKKNGKQINPKIYSCLTAVMESFDPALCYCVKNSENGYTVRKVLDYNLSDHAAADKAAIDAAVAAGTPRAEAVAPYTDDSAFEAWYADFVAALNAAAEG